MRTHTLAFTLLICAAMSACSPTAADRVLEPTAASDVRLDQYRRDAAATQAADKATVEARARDLLATDTYATATASAVAAIMAANGTATQVAAGNATATATEAIRQQATGTAVAAGQQTATATAAIAQAVMATDQAVQSATGTAVVEGTQTAIRLRDEQNKADRDQMMNWALGVAEVLAVFVIIGLAAYSTIHAVRLLRRRGSVIAYGPNGNPLVLADNGRGATLVNPLANTSAITTLTGDGHVIADQLPEQARLQVMLGMLRVLMEQASHSPFPPIPGQPGQPERTERWRVGPVEHETRVGAMPGQVYTPQPHPVIQTEPSRPALPDPAMPQDAPWQILNGWRGGALPLGLGAGGLLLADPEYYPHLLIAGTTGSGKSRYALKPIITAALADAWQVVILDRNGLHFSAFRGHPNAHVKLLDSAESVIGYLDALHAEVDRRFKWLAVVGAESWRTAPEPKAPRLLTVIDDFSILSDSLDTSGRKEMWLSARRLLADSRKSGIHVALVVQNPTWQSIDLGIRRNCTPMTFRVNDSEASRVVVNAAGAETLPPRQFLTVLDSLQRGMAFAPEDDQIAAFLGSRQVPALPAPEWLDAVSAGDSDSLAPEIAIIAAAIRPLLERGASKRAMARAVGQEYAGAFTRKLDAAIEWITSAPTTATTT